MPRAKFLPGETYSTPGALRALEASGDDLLAFLFRHLGGDWGVIDDEDKQTNEEALLDGSRLMSVYVLASGVRLWVITDAADAAGVRHATTFLLPAEY